MRLPNPSRRIILLTVALTLILSGAAKAQEDGGVSVIRDGGGQEVLESIFIPPIPHAPFSLTLATQWVRPMNNGGTFTLENSRPIKRDSSGRIYQERWGLVPKGSGIESEIMRIQIYDPNAHTLYQCTAAQHSCELITTTGSNNIRYEPSHLISGPLPNGKGYSTHEDLGTDNVAGIPVHGYRDTTTLNPGVVGNDLPMSMVREFHYSAALGINLRSTLDAPQIGRQQFTATEITTTEPELSFFQPPQGYRVIDHRKNAQPEQ